MPPPPSGKAPRAAPNLPPCGPRTAVLKADFAALVDAGDVAKIELREVETNGPGRRLPEPIYYVAAQLAEGVAPRSAGRWRYFTTRRDPYQPRRFYGIEVANRLLRDVAPGIAAEVVRASRLPPSAPTE